MCLPAIRRLALCGTLFAGCGGSYAAAKIADAGTADSGDNAPTNAADAAVDSGPSVAVASAGRAGQGNATGGESGSSGAAGTAAVGGGRMSSARARAGAVNGATAIYPQPGQMAGLGQLPPKVASVTYDGSLIYDNPQIVRDLGFSGVVNGQIIWTFGDTLLQQSGGGSAFSASDSAALGDLDHPTHVHDKSLNASGGPAQWIPLTAAEQANGGLGRYAEGGTNVVEYAPNKGLVWFLKNDRGGGSDNILGAGVATVTADASGPKAIRVADSLWNANEPYWGDIGVTYNPLDKNVYVFGHGPAAANLGANVYLAKVNAARASDISAYTQDRLK